MRYRESLETQPDILQILSSPYKSPDNDVHLSLSSMNDDFDPSPQVIKRRRTATYKASRSVLEEKENVRREHSIDKQTPQWLVSGWNETSTSAPGTNMNSFTGDKKAALQHLTIEHEGKLAVARKRGSKSATQSNANKDQISPLTTTRPIDGMEGTIVVQPRSSGREKKRPRRYSMSPEQPKIRKQSPVPKVLQRKQKPTPKTLGQSTIDTTPRGILTPLRSQKRTGPRKSVNFDHNTEEIEKQLGFRDIDVLTDKTSNSATRSTSQERKVEARARSTIVPPGKTIPEQISPSDLETEAIYSIEYNSRSLGTNDKPATLVQVDRLFGDPDIDEDPAILAIKSSVLTRLNGKGSDTVPLHLQAQYDTLHLLLRATVTSGESNSLLLLGARGTGKSHLLATALSALGSSYPNDFHTICLNGFYQTDDKLALREIWRQLGREMQVDETETSEIGVSYADTMASLLSLLAHPDEYAASGVAGDVTENIAGPTRTSKSVIFVLDEFDLFTTHPRQTLLYNLFDIAQSKKAPVAVIGCSTRMDVVDCLEKRVKSRFSQRWLHIPSIRKLDDFQTIIKDAICHGSVRRNSDIVTSILPPTIVDKWNEYMRSVFLPSPYVQDLIKHNFHTTKSIPDTLSALYIPVATARISELPSQNDSIMKIAENCMTAHPTLLILLPNLPTLHLALLIAASRLDTIHDLANMNFNLVYTHYTELISRAKLQITASGAVAVGASLRQWNRRTAQSAWEDLGAHECIVPVSRAGVIVTGLVSGREGAGGNDSIGGEGSNIRLWRVEVTLEDLEWAVKQKWTESGGARDLLSKWCREI